MTEKQRPLLIAEVKTQSPFGFTSPYRFGELLELASAVGDWVAVHTEAPWGGSLDNITNARLVTSKPILAKGIHREDADVYAALDRGASAVLVVGRMPPDPLRCWYELPPEEIVGERYPHDFSIVAKATAVVWNSRNIYTGERRFPNYEGYDFFRTRNAWNGVLIQASNIQTPADIYDDVDAILVGEHLPTFAPLWRDYCRSLS
jgi:indole-3-glycerol phosphate synthase